MEGKSNLNQEHQAVRAPQNLVKSSKSSKSSREERALTVKIKMTKLMAEAKYMEGRQSLVFQTESLKVAKEIAKTKAQIHILEEPGDKILGRKEVVTSPRSVLHNTSSHQNEPGRSRTVPVEAKLNMVNICSGASR